MPLDLGQKTEPEPDFVVGVGVPLAATTTGHPTSALLIIEVSESTLKYDQGDKASLYARVGVRDYWIIDLVPPAQVVPLALPGKLIAVADLLP